MLGRDLDEPDIGPGEVLAATEAVVAALEIVDSRVAGWDISIVDTVADNASSGLFTLGPERVAPDRLDLAGCPMRLWRGTARGVPRAPVRPAWATRPPRSPGSRPRPGTYGQPLRAGEIVLSGALGPMVPVAAGDRFTADIGGLGRVTAVFAGGAR